MNLESLPDIIIYLLYIMFDVKFTLEDPYDSSKRQLVLFLSLYTHTIIHIRITHIHMIYIRQFYKYINNIYMIVTHVYVCMCTYFFYVLTLDRHFQHFIDITSFNLQKDPHEVNISLKVKLVCYNTLKMYVEGYLSLMCQLQESVPCQRVYPLHIA